MIKNTKDNFFKIQNKYFTMLDFFNELKYYNLHYSLFDKILKTYYKNIDDAEKIIADILHNIFIKYNIPSSIENYLNLISVYTNGNGWTISIRIKFNNETIIGFTLYRDYIKHEFDKDTDDIFEYYIYDRILCIYYNSISYYIEECNKIFDIDKLYNGKFISKIGVRNSYVRGYTEYVRMRNLMKYYYKIILSLPLVNTPYVQDYIITNIILK